MSDLNKKISVRKISNSPSIRTEDYVAIEEPLEIQICSPKKDLSAAKSLSITMRTPGNDHELALGFLCSESIISSHKDIDSIASIGEAQNKDGLQNIVRVTLNQSVDFDPSDLERHFYTTSSCGVCGKTSIEAIRAKGIKVNSSKFSIKKEKILGF